MARNGTSPHAMRPCGGFSLVELMVALVIGLMLVFAVTGLLIGSSAGSRTNNRSTEIQNGGRDALEFLRRDLLHAGFRGMTWAEPVLDALGTVGGDCAPGMATNLRQRLWGANDGNPFAATCIPAASYGTGDVVVIRRAALAPATTLAADTLYLRSAYESGRIFKGNAPPTTGSFPWTPRQDYRLETVVYYVSPYTHSSTENPRIPALYRAALQPGPAMGTPELVASGIEDLQIQYGRLMTDGTTRYFDAASLSAATATTTDPSEWDEVVSVRIWLLARSATTEPGYRNTNTYALGERNVTVDDGYRRQVFSTVVQLRNS